VYVCETRGRRVIRLDKKGKLDVIADAWEGKRFNGPNDIALGKNGRIYFTDPAFGSAEDTRELPFYGIYHATSKGEVQLAAKTGGRPNGLAFSPDGETLYVADSDARSVIAYDIDKRGAASNERTLISGIAGVPDGLRVDKEGQIYVAARELLVFTPDGKPVRSIPIAEKPSAVAFGDGDMGTLYITARSSLYRFRPEPEARH
jgi:gluconolactonase